MKAKSLAVVALMLLLAGCSGEPSKTPEKTTTTVSIETTEMNPGIQEAEPYETTTEAPTEESLADNKIIFRELLPVLSANAAMYSEDAEFYAEYIRNGGTSLADGSFCMEQVYADEIARQFLWDGAKIESINFFNLKAYRALNAEGFMGILNDVIAEHDVEPQTAGDFSYCQNFYSKYKDSRIFYGVVEGYGVIGITNYAADTLRCPMQATL